MHTFHCDRNETKLTRFKVTKPEQVTDLNPLDGEFSISRDKERMAPMLKQIHDIAYHFSIGDVLRIITKQIAEYAQEFIGHQKKAAPLERKLSFF